MRIDRNGMRATVKIGRKKGECRTRYAKVGGESGEKNIMDGPRRTGMKDIIQ